MIQIGIRLHDVNTGLPEEEQTLERRAMKAKEEGFSCVQLAFGKVMKGITFDACALTEGLGFHAKRVLEANGLDTAVLGCYLNLAHPDPEKLAEIRSRYYGNIRVASVLGAGCVGTETGAPNAAYKTDANTHTKEALETFIRGLDPVVECAENYGVTMAIEPVWNHIVHTPDRALAVLKAIGSRNLRIIFDPVNLLCMDNADRREEVFADAVEKLGDYITVVHLKDFVREDGKLISVAAGTGEMDYRQVLSFVKARKPWIQATLENTSNENASAAREHILRVYDGIQ